MNHRSGLDRTQTLLFPERLEDYVAADNPVRFLDAFVAALDLHALGFAKARCANTGRPPYDPAVLLKLYLYGYLHRVRSSRLLEAESHRNVEVIWLVGKLTPDFKTIADFRKDNLKPLQGVARQFTLLCRKLELFGGELLANTDARLAEYFQLLDQSDVGAVTTSPLTPAALQQKIAALQERRAWHAELLEQLDAEQKQVSVTDPDTRRMPVAQGNVVGYNAQVAVDAKHKLIAADAVTNAGNDCQQLADVALAAKANLAIEQAEILADTGYYNVAEVSRCVEHGLSPLIPKADTSANTKLGLYGKSQFHYEPEKDRYVCPAGGALTYRFSTWELGRELKYYRAKGCQQCALKPQCTRNQANRTITREANEHLIEQMAARLKAQPAKYALRKQLAEHPFGTIKRWFGYTHFTLKGLTKVRTEWSLITLTYNLKRVLNLVSLEKLLAAVA